MYLLIVINLTLTMVKQSDTHFLTGSAFFEVVCFTGSGMAGSTSIFNGKESKKLKTVLYLVLDLTGLKQCMFFVLLIIKDFFIRLFR